MMVSVPSVSAKLKTAVDNQALLKALTGLQQPKYNILPIHLKQGRAASPAEASLLQSLHTAPHELSVTGAAHPQKLQNGEGGWQSWGGWEELM